ncbi:MAG TPA: hypothetical protein VJL61_15710 [Rhodanobacteraceae bacterium]|nr:hypothetical protein [Rhodanobacteraceae bacterium]
MIEDQQVEGLRARHPQRRTAVAAVGDFGAAGADGLGEKCTADRIVFGQKHPKLHGGDRSQALVGIHSDVGWHNRASHSGKGFP